MSTPEQFDTSLSSGKIAEALMAEYFASINFTVTNISMEQHEDSYCPFDLLIESNNFRAVIDVKSRRHSNMWFFLHSYASWMEYASDAKKLVLFMQPYQPKRSLFICAEIILDYAVPISNRLSTLRVPIVYTTPVTILRKV